MKIKEEWISETMESLDGIRRAEIDPVISGNLLHQMKNPAAVVVTFRTPAVLKAAATILLLISFNVITILYLHETPDHENNIWSVASEYFSYIGSINL